MKKGGGFYEVGGTTLNHVEYQILAREWVDSLLGRQEKGFFQFFNLLPQRLVFVLLVRKLFALSLIHLVLVIKLLVLVVKSLTLSLNDLALLLKLLVFFL